MMSINVHSSLAFYKADVIMSYHKKQLKGGLDKEEIAAKIVKKKPEQHGRWLKVLSDCCGKPYPIIATVKLCVVAGDEVGSQNPDGSCRWWHIQTPEGDGADVPFNLWLLEPEEKSVLS